MAQVFRAAGDDQTGADDQVVLDSIPLPAVLVVDDDVVACNERATRLVPRCEVGVSLSSWFAPHALDVLVDGAEVVAKTADDDRWLALHLGERDHEGRRLVVLRDVTNDEFAMAALDGVADSTFVLDGGGRPRWRSEQLRQRSGVPDEIASQMNPSERIHPEDLPLVLDSFVDARPDRPSRVVVRSRAVHDDQMWETIEIVIHHRLEHDLLAGYLVQVHNLDDGVRLDAGLDGGPAEWLSLTEAAPVGIAVTDIVGEIVYRNRAAREFLGRDIESLGWNSRWLELARPEDRPALRDAFDAAIRRGESATVTAAFDDGGGGFRWLRLVASPQRSATERPRGLIATLEDVTEQMEARAQLDDAEALLRHMATHDPLTGLPNRASITDRITEALARHDRDQDGLALLFCDLDGFKPINDQHGHGAGDEALVEVAARLRYAAGADNFVARIGGDEFVVLHEGLGDTGAVDALTARLHASLEVPFMVAGQQMTLGTSIGVALLVAGATSTADILLRVADQAMYTAKDAGPGHTSCCVVDA